MRKNVLIGKSWLIPSFLLLSTMCFAQVSQEWVVRETGTGMFDGTRSLALDSAGNVYVTGSSMGAGTGNDYLTIKYNTAGVKQWEVRYNGAANLDDDAFSIAVDNNGNVYVTGRSSNATGSNIATIKYNSAGVMQWVATYNGWGRSIAVDGQGNVYVTGETTGAGTGTDFLTIKYNTAGIQQWVSTYDRLGFSDAAIDLALDAVGNVYVTGYSAGGGDIDEADLDIATIKYDNNGNELWVRIYDGPVAGNLPDEGRAIATDAAGNVYVTGLSSGIGTGHEDEQDVATIKYDTNGNELWVARYNGPASSADVGFDVGVDASQNVYITGLTFSEPDANSNYLTIRYDVNGNEVWVATYNGPGNGEDIATSLALDSSGNVYVTGRSQGAGTGFDIATLKYNTAGVQQWVARYNGPGNGDDGTGIFIGFFTSHPIGVDEAGNVYVTGLSTGINTGFDYTTIKYSQPMIACSENGDKVLLCHKGKTLCVSRSAVSNHLSHGDQLGACSATVSGDNNARLDQPSTLPNQIPIHFQVSVVPNPAVATTKIYYELPADARVSLKVFDMLGREIATLVDASKQAGFHSADLNVAALQKGMYHYRITVKTANQVWLKTGKISVVD
jgi:hypothetical protein